MAKISSITMVRCEVVKDGRDVFWWSMVYKDEEEDEEEGDDGDDGDDDDETMN